MTDTTTEHSEPARPLWLPLNDQLGQAPTRAQVAALMKRCQIGVGGRSALDIAHGIMADCYGTLGRQQIELARLGRLLCELAECEPLSAATSEMPADLLERWQAACDAHISRIAG